WCPNVRIDAVICGVPDMSEILSDLNELRGYDSGRTKSVKLRVNPCGAHEIHRMPTTQGIKIRLNSVPSGSYCATAVSCRGAKYGIRQRYDDLITSDGACRLWTKLFAD